MKVLCKTLSDMGNNNSSRGNQLARRTQHQKIFAIKDKAEKVKKDIKKFNAPEENEEYESLKQRLRSLQQELHKFEKTLQPANRNVFNLAGTKINDIYNNLENKLKENREKEEKRQEKEAKKKEKELEKTEVVNIDSNEDYEVHEVNEAGDYEATHLENATDKRKTVELHCVKIENVEDQRPVKSPEEKRKSILKYGVAVMPGAITRELEKNAEMSNDFSLEKRLDDIKVDVGNLELRINEFVGKRDGKHYKCLQSPLLKYSSEIDKIVEQNSSLWDQGELIRRYINSCLTFLDSKAVDADNSDDEVFSNTYSSKIYGSTHDLLGKKSVRTSVV